LLLEKEFDSFGAVSQGPSLYPFVVKVLVPESKTPRDPCFDKWHDNTMNLIEKILNGNDILPDELILVYPERWLSKTESSDFMSALLENKFVNKIKCLKMVTESNFLLRDFFPESIKKI
jgi:hypothetical protein